jgi:hypothetical protein
MIGSITPNMAETLDYESEGRTFESFRARQQLFDLYIKFVRDFGPLDTGIRGAAPGQHAECSDSIEP